jgi:outer membrane protein assembly factor BamB
MKSLFSCIMLLLTAGVSFADDVTQFRNGLGTSTEKNLPTRWSATEGVRWKANLPGKGLSNPVIAGGRVFVSATAAYEQKREVVLCFDVKTGKKLWERQVWATGHTQSHPKTNMAAPTPMTDGDRVYALFATGDLVCYDRDGDLVWYRSLVGDYPTVGNNVGMAASPAISGDTLLICMENAGESFAVGIDKFTGKNSWRIDRPRGINWVSPVVIDNAGKPEVLFQGPTGIDAHDVATGKKKWSAPKFRHGAYATLTFGNGLVFAPTDKHFVALKPARDNAEPEVVWQTLKLRPGYCSPVAHDGLVYIVMGGGFVHCADAKTGDVFWTHRIKGTASYAASPLLADGKLYVTDEAGITTVLQAGREEKLLASNAIDDTILASPVAADGAIFLRSDRALYCIGPSLKR